ncbi:hypothetical protein J3R82DRAFT_11010 [Butyriboletus roseoflavus]|nr:hypothetical protein J3R82DRAFT_11010 [Butyriboletus roseoflavus]
MLTGSGDVTTLAWTGTFGSYNSCLPTDLTVYDQLVPPHVPQSIEATEVDHMVMKLPSSSPVLAPVLTLCSRFRELPSPFLAASRLRLAGVVFPLTDLVLVVEGSSESGLNVYRGLTSTLGDVEIQTTDKLEMRDLVLMYPWISPLLGQEFASHSATGLDDTARAAARRSPQATIRCAVARTTVARAIPACCGGSSKFAGRHR